MYTAKAERIEKQGGPRVETWGLTIHKHTGTHRQKVGFLDVEFHVEDNALIALLDNVHTHPHYRRQGVATMLLDTLLDWPRTAGLEHVLAVYTGNTHAVALYLKNGFAFVQEPPPYVPGGTSLLLPMRRLGAEQETVGDFLKVTEVKNHETYV